VLTDLAVNDTGQAIVYLLIFCAGVAAGMAILTTVIGLPFLVSSARSERINRWLTIGSGALSLAFGLYLAYQIGFVDGLFTGDFTWEPH
jgi:high-affinity nickel-transport protein